MFPVGAVACLAEAGTGKSNCLIHGTGYQRWVTKTREHLPIKVIAIPPNSPQQIFSLHRFVLLKPQDDLLVGKEQLRNVAPGTKVNTCIILLHQATSRACYRRDVVFIWTQVCSFKEHLDISKDIPYEHFPECVTSRLANQIPTHDVCLPHPLQCWYTLPFHCSLHALLW